MISSIWRYNSRGFEYCTGLYCCCCSLPAGLRRCCRRVNVTLFSRVTLIRKPQSTSDVDHFHAWELPCSRVKSRDNPISGVEEIAEFCIPLYIEMLCIHYYSKQFQQSIEIKILKTVNYYHLRHHSPDGSIIVCRWYVKACWLHAVIHIVLLSYLVHLIGSINKLTAWFCWQWQKVLRIQLLLTDYNTNLHNAAGCEVAAGTLDGGTAVPVGQNDWPALRQSWAGAMVSAADHTWENDGSWSSLSDVSPARFESAAGSAHIPADSRMVRAISSAICSGVNVTSGCVVAVFDAADTADGAFSLLSFFLLDFDTSDAWRPLAIR